MSDERNCKPFLEMLFGVNIEKVVVSKEKSIGYLPDKRSVRLDVYVKDENNTHYNIEMQALQKDSIVKRTRYYHSQIDMDLISTGTYYKDLPPVYVIFICDFDPFNWSKYCYTVKSKCVQVPELEIDDGVETIYLNTLGTNESEVSDSLKNFLKFVHAPLEESKTDFHDPYVKQLQSSIAQVKKDREMGAEYMIFQELIDEEIAEVKEEARAEGRAEGREEGREEGRAEGREVKYTP